ncbi:40S ribosomal protein SA [Myotis brandtii]|uniref:40S ribosomal protein SA n=1 Tax=Myotis brandtii TaxID=109478 RepID=S7PA62_MYOBR|nr:40S ribosomal protein SA [Myotis brandtii]
MSRDLAVLRMKEQEVLKFLAAGTHLGGTNLTPKWNSTSAKGKVVASAWAAHQPLTEAANADLSAIALCDTDSPPGYVELAFTFNYKGAHSAALMWRKQGQEVLRMCGPISCVHLHQPLTEAANADLSSIALCDTDSPPAYVELAFTFNYKGLTQRL